MAFGDLTCSESEFQRVGIITENTQVLAWALAMGKDNKGKPDERSPLGLGAKENMDNIYEGCPGERIW